MRKIAQVLMLGLLAAACAAPRDEPSDLADASVQALMANQPVRARQLADQAIAQDGRNPTALLALGLILENAGDLRTARDYFAAAALSGANRPAGLAGGEAGRSVADVAWHRLTAIEAVFARQRMRPPATPIGPNGEPETVVVSGIRKPLVAPPDALVAPAEASETSAPPETKSKPSPEAKIAAPPAPAPKTAIATDPTLYALHLASYRHQAEAEEGWQMLQRRAGTALAGLEPLFGGIDIPGKGHYLRLYAGPPMPRDEADRLCIRLNAQKIYCQTLKP